MIRKLMGISLLLSLAPVAQQAIAQNYPVKPVRMVIAFPPGGSTDIVGRLVAQKMSERLGQPVPVENRGGAGGTIGTEAVAKAAPDGYTITLATTSTHVVAPAAYPKLGYDAIKDFAPVSLVAVTPYLLVVNPAFPAKTVQELVSHLKTRPGKYNYASAGSGSTTQIAMEMLKLAAGLYVVHIPYNGNAPAGTAVVAGQVEILFGSMPAVLPLAKGGRVRAIAVGTLKRSPAMPEVPTVAESGFPGFDASLWLAVMTPAGVPQPILGRLHKEVLTIIGNKDNATALDKAGAEALTSTPDELTALIRDGVQKYSKVIKEANIKVD
ncbi:MAG: tripartite tricarboxylate transporter substrate binding protein [Betaproteobacteria bacterium]|nr:tripartite tricarboxylate transporter substrate binding protein [Betaproteobacteria bacterium]